MNTVDLKTATYMEDWSYLTWMNVIFYYLWYLQYLVIFLYINYHIVYIYLYVEFKPLLRHPISNKSLFKSHV